MSRQRRPSQAVAAGSCVVILASALSGCGSDLFYEITAAQPSVRLPADEAPHCYGGEWWYYTGRLATEDGRPFGIEAVIFHDARLPVLVLTAGWAAHFAVLDEAAGTFVYDQRRWLDGASFACPKPGGFELNTPLVQMSGTDGRDHLRAAMSDGSYAVDLILEDERGAVLHGESGYVPYGQHGRSFYYSRPVMRASGTLHTNGQLHNVDGQLWFDRQWGRDLQNPWLGWDWFSLRLDDGASVMLFVFRDTVPLVAHGTFIPARGEPRQLNPDDFVITPTTTWVSPRTGAAYPVAWEIEIPPEQLLVSVTAVADDQELDVRATTLNVYWEGMCSLAGTHADHSVEGLAFVELTNYAN